MLNFIMLVLVRWLLPPMVMMLTVTVVEDEPTQTPEHEAERPEQPQSTYG